MQLEKHFDVARSRDDVVEILCRDETLLALVPGETRITASSGDDRTTVTHYTALGREGEATFNWHFLMDGSIRFDKVCDGHVWRELEGSVSVEERGDGSTVRLEMRGRTKSFVPEFTIKGPMEGQIGDMADALRALLESR